MGILRITSQTHRRSSHIFAQIWPTLLWSGKLWWNRRRYFTRDFLHFSHSVGPSVIVEHFWCFYWGPRDFVYDNRNLSEWDQSCWICFSLRQKMPQMLPQKDLRHLWYPSVFALSVSRGGTSWGIWNFSFSFIIICLLPGTVMTLWLYLLILQQVAVEGKSLQKTIFKEWFQFNICGSYFVFKVTLGLGWEAGVCDLVWEVMLAPKGCIPGGNLGSQRAFVGSELPANLNDLDRGLLWIQLQRDWEIK